MQPNVYTLTMIQCNQSASHSQKESQLRLPNKTKKEVLLLNLSHSTNTNT